ncbi:MAG TPA: 50S ribosomal protein L9 [Candidatus Paceibacterota bacterium]
MKVVLLNDVPKVGRKNDVKDVSDGYAFNFLIPKGLVETATSKSLKRVELIKKQEAEQKKIKQDLLLKNFGDLKGVKIDMEKVANDKGHLFAAIHAGEIVTAIKDQTRLDVEAEFIIIKEPIKTVGEHEIEVKVEDRSVTFTLNVKGLEEKAKVEHKKSETAEKPAKKETKKKTAKKS